MSSDKATDPVISPCVAICTVDPQTGFCRGCYRSMAEIGGWMMMSDPERRAVLAAIAERRQALGADAIEAARAARRAERRQNRRRSRNDA